jgi:hypothetical protein
MAGDSTIGSILEEMATLERDLDSEVRRQLAVVFKSVDPGELGEEMAAIVYRVKRVEEMLSHTVEQGRLELEVALRLSEGLDRLRSAGEGGPSRRP